MRAYFNRARAQFAHHESLSGAALALVMSIMAGTHLWQASYFAWPSGQFKNMHLGLALIVVFLTLATARQSRFARAAFLVLAATALIPLVYIHIEYEALVSERMFGPIDRDVAVSILLLAVTLIAAVFQWGWTLPIISSLALLYGYFGNYLPGDLLFHAGIGLDRLMSYTAIPFFQGLLGSLTGLSATLVFIFMLYAGLLNSTGGIRFVMAVGSLIGGRSRTAPAQIAVVASGFMGMISGSTVGNVASTGVMTIPLMKRCGYKADHAGAIEAVASTGGQFTPPVMGLTAFLIVGMTGIPYDQIMLAAVLPALIYYGYLLVAVRLQALSGEAQTIAASAPNGAPPHLELNADGVDVGDISLLDAARQYGHLVLSIVVLVYLLVAKLPPAYCALYAIGTLAITETIKHLLLARRAPIRGLMNAARILASGIMDGTRNGAQLAIIIAAIGILVDIFVVTGFAQKLSHLMLNVATGDQLILLGLAAISCLVFGLGMPTPAAYILVALLGAPALVEFGIPLLAAHMFVFYFANMSAITPPVAVASLVAANLAKGSYFGTTFAALRLGLPGFVLPFFFIYKPELLLLKGNLLTQAFAALTIFLAIVAVNLVLTNRALIRLTVIESIALVIGAGAIFYPSLSATVLGLAVISGVVTWQFIAARRSAAAG